MTQHYDQPDRQTRLTRLGLLGVWAVLSLAAAGFVVALGSNTPTVDEWEFIPVLTGHEPVRPWLWAQLNEHRMPLPKAAFVALVRLTGDFRTGMVVSVGLLSALSLGLVRLADYLRGRPHWADAFFPVSLLHLGHWENLLMGYQLCFVLFAVLATGLGVVALVATREAAFRSGLAAGVLVLLLGLCGGTGLVLIPPVAAWLVYLAGVLRSDGRPARAVGLVVLAAVTVGYLAAYFVGYQRPAHGDPGDGGPLAIVRVTGQVLAMALGIGVSGVWWLVALGTVALGALTLRAVARDLRDPEERPAAVGLLAVAVGLVGVAVAVGVGRSWNGPEAGLWSRYAMLTWPLLGVAYLVWATEVGGEPAPPGDLRTGARWVPILLCVAATLAFPTNMLTGLLNGVQRREVLATVEDQVRAGVPPEHVVRLFANTSQAGQEERAVRGIPMLRDAGLGSFGGRPAGGINPWWVGGLAAAVLAGFAFRWVFHLGRAVQIERARELFRLQHERFEHMLLAAAAGTGKPRGLDWVGCEITGDAVLARDTATGGIIALVPVVIRFEPVAGSDMEDVPAAKEPRPATAVFTFRRGHWHTDGRVVFNLSPHQTVSHFGPQYRVIEPHH